MLTYRDVSRLMCIMKFLNIKGFIHSEKDRFLYEKLEKMKKQLLNEQYLKYRNENKKNIKNKIRSN